MKDVSKAALGALTEGQIVDGRLQRLLLVRLRLGLGRALEVPVLDNKSLAVE